MCKCQCKELEQSSNDGDFVRNIDTRPTHLLTHTHTHAVIHTGIKHFHLNFSCSWSNSSWGGSRLTRIHAKFTLGIFMAMYFIWNFYEEQHFINLFSFFSLHSHGTYSLFFPHIQMRMWKSVKSINVNRNRCSLNITHCYYIFFMCFYVGTSVFFFLHFLRRVYRHFSLLI